MNEKRTERATEEEEKIEKEAKTKKKNINNQF